MKLPLIDVHAHLDELDDLPHALEEARKEGLKAIVAVGMDLPSNERTLKIARENPGFVFAAIGYHPWEIRKGEVEGNLDFLRKEARNCVAIGEVGLDYRARVKKDLQKEVFGEVIRIALQHQKPLILHCRYSHRRVFEMIAEAGVRKAVFHWYTGPLDLLEEIIKAGYYISATPALTYSPPHQAAIKEAPLERILLETDTPVQYKDLVSRPKDVLVSLRGVARIKGMDPAEVASLTTRNAAELFGLDAPSPFR